MILNDVINNHFKLIYRNLLVLVVFLTLIKTNSLVLGENRNGNSDSRRNNLKFEKNDLKNYKYKMS